MMAGAAARVIYAAILTSQVSQWYPVEVKFVGRLSRAHPTPTLQSFILSSQFLKELFFAFS